jgi:hypothetical protein
MSVFHAGSGLGGAVMIGMLWGWLAFLPASVKAVRLAEGIFTVKHFLSNA